MHMILLDVVLFVPSACGASAYAYVMYRLLRTSPRPPTPPDGGSKVPLPLAGPDDLARSA